MIVFLLEFSLNQIDVLRFIKKIDSLFDGLNKKP